MTEGLTPLEWVGVFGSFASIVSVILNVVLGLRNRDLKRHLESVVCSAEKSLGTLRLEADSALSKHPAHWESSLRAIQAQAADATQSLGQFRSRYLRVKKV